MSSLVQRQSHKFGFGSFPEPLQSQGMVILSSTFALLSSPLLPIVLPSFFSRLFIYLLILSPPFTHVIFSPYFSTPLSFFSSLILVVHSPLFSSSHLPFIHSSFPDFFFLFISRLFIYFIFNFLIIYLLILSPSFIYLFISFAVYTFPFHLLLNKVSIVGLLHRVYFRYSFFRWEIIHYVAPSLRIQIRKCCAKLETTFQKFIENIEALHRGAVLGPTTKMLDN